MKSKDSFWRALFVSLLLPLCMSFVEASDDIIVPYAKPIWETVEKSDKTFANKKRILQKNSLVEEIKKSQKISKEDSTKWLVLVGVENYKNADPVSFSLNSSEAFLELATRKYGIPKRNIYAYLDEKATSGSISDELEVMLRHVKKGDTIYFYYSGHGIPVKNKNDENVPFLLPYDNIPSMIGKSQFFSLENLYARLSDSDASRVVVFMDACFSGVTDNKAQLKGVASARLVPKKAKIDTKKLTIFSAGKGTQFSNMYEKEQQRLFSYYLIKGIMDGKERAEDLHRYIFENVKKESHKMGDIFIQEPTIEGNLDAKL